MRKKKISSSKLLFVHNPLVASYTIMKRCSLTLVHNREALSFATLAKVANLRILAEVRVLGLGPET